MKFIVYLIAVMVCVECIAEEKSSPPAVGKNDWLVKHPTIVKLVELTNSQRASQGVGPVVLDEEMSLAAQRHAQWMADQGGFQHSGLPYMEIIHQSVTSPEAAVNG